MLFQSLIFVVALVVLLFSARFFTRSAEKIGYWMKLPPFVIGIFIVGIGTSLPELIAGILAVTNDTSEILPGNVIGANISNLLLVTGFAVAIHGKTIQLKSSYIYIDLHFLVGSFAIFYIIAYDGIIQLSEAFVGGIVFLIYSFYLIRGGTAERPPVTEAPPVRQKFPLVAFLVLLVTIFGIYIGADYTVSSLSQLALGLSIPASIVALTALSLGTTLPELIVNITALRQGKAEMAIGNILGSCIFNTLIIPTIASCFGPIHVPLNLLAFALPVMAVSGLLFYLLTHDKQISPWEGLLFVMIYVLFVIKTAGF